MLACRKVALDLLGLVEHRAAWLLVTNFCPPHEEMKVLLHLLLAVHYCWVFTTQGTISGAGQEPTDARLEQFLNHLLPYRLIFFEGGSRQQIWYSQRLAGTRAMHDLDVEL